MSERLDGPLPATPPEAAPRSVAGASMLFFGASVAASAGYFIAVLLLARGLGPAQRGTVAFVTVTATLVPRLALLGVGEATAVFAARPAADRPRLLTNLVLVALVTATVAGVVVCGALLLLGDARPAGVRNLEVAALGAGILASAFVEAGYDFVLGCSRFLERAVVTVVVPWAYAFSVAAVSAGPGLTAARGAFLWAGAQTLGALLLLGASLRGIGLGRPQARLLAKTVRFGVRTWVGSLASFINARADQIIIGFIAGDAALGVYAVAVNGSEMLLYLPSALGAALLPAIVRTDPAVRAERTLRAFRALALVTLVAVALAAAVGSPLLPRVFGSAYDASVGPFLWLLPGALGFAAISVFASALIGSSSPGLGSVGFLVTLVVGLALDFALIPPFGAEGAAAAQTAAFLAGGAAAAAAYRRRETFTAADLLPRRGDLELLGSAVRRSIRMGRAG